MRKLILAAASVVALACVSTAQAEWRYAPFEATAASVAGWPVPVICRDYAEWPDEVASRYRARTGHNIAAYYSPRERGSFYHRTSA